MAQTKYTKQLLKFIREATSPFHCVQAIKRQLDENGYQELYLNKSWQLALLLSMIALMDLP